MDKKNAPIEKEQIITEKNLQEKVLNNEISTEDYIRSIRRISIYGTENPTFKNKILLGIKLISGLFSWVFLYVIAMYLNGEISKNVLTLFFIITLATVMTSIYLEDYPKSP